MTVGEQGEAVRERETERVEAVAESGAVGVADRVAERVIADAEGVERVPVYGLRDCEALRVAVLDGLGGVQVVV